MILTVIVLTALISACRKEDLSERLRVICLNDGTVYVNLNGIVTRYVYDGCGEYDAHTVDGPDGVADVGTRDAESFFVMPDDAIVVRPAADGLITFHLTGFTVAGIMTIIRICMNGMMWQGLT